MDPSIEACTDSQDSNQRQMDVSDEVSDLLHSDGESVPEIGNSENDFDDELKSTTEEDTDSEKSVHIIFVRGEHEGIPATPNSNAKMENLNGAENNGNDMTERLPMQKVRVSAVPCRAVSCPNEFCDAGSEISTQVSEKISEEEVEDDFDGTEEMLFQDPQKSPPPCSSRKRRKKKFYKVCKACGELVERQDFISHIREHRRRKLKFAQNLSPNIIEPSVKKVEQTISSLSPAEKISTQSDSSRTSSNIIRDTNLPQSSLNTLSDRPFKCSVCTETFRTQSSLTIHFKSHSGECSNSCPVS